ncbi:MAG: L,D-transpeptidase [Bosea sp.]|uniref:L,D-transpeptidase n=1 Tax=Bosea sp. (in: a-proteobacteria) TaxID=1871050 RepID=UPI00239D9A8B|nr:L,D-transpeptidase [Bosea sp. (in: a-proteobacteria)]MCP4740133.1 L,D-transpeptidase [Bosea sp. (in: a-proteobacteria)]
MPIDRRRLLLGSPFLLSGCVTRPTTQRPSQAAIDRPDMAEADYPSIYAAVDGEPFSVPAIDLSEIEPEFLRREVGYRTAEQPGTVVVDPGERYAYLVGGGGRAIRYGIGVGKEEGFNFRGAATIARKAQWPRWTPTPDMIRREPQRYGRYAGGLAGGAGNPLGPRALYLYRDGRDTLYRLHGTVEPWTIGTMVSSGCIRLLNQDIMDLYRRVPVGSRVVVLGSGGATAV